ncbi:MAG: DUF1080 domain-containing protein [Planctomycetes bacterium]|nr:DUF1080 domain-containing protein [Planctomycetota bacterium]
MIIDIKKLTVIIVLMATVFLPCSFAAENPVAAILDKMPAENAAQEKELAAELVKFAPGAMSWICRQIVAPGTGDDSKARYAVSSLVSYVSRPDAQPNIKMLYSLVLAKALEKAADKEVKSFFITQLQFVGDDDSVPAVSKYLGDKRLCEPASFTLQTIGTDTAKKAVLKALPTATKDTLPTIIYALGQMRVKDAVKEITWHATIKDRTIRLVSLDALAEIGDPASVKVIEKALKVKDPYERGIVASNYVNLAERLLQIRRRDDAVNICKNILNSADPAIKSSDKASALSVIFDELGRSASQYLEYAFDNGDAQLQDAAMTLTNKSESPSLTKMWSEKLGKVTPEKQVRILEMLGKRKSFSQYLHNAYSNGDSTVKIAAMKALISRGQALPSIFRSIGSDDDQAQAAKAILLQMPTDRFASTAVQNLRNIKMGISKMPAKGQIAIIEVLAERRVSSSLEAVFSLTSSKDSSVSVAATKALTNLAGPADITRVIDLMLKTKSSAQRAEASRVVVQLSKQDPGKAAKPLLGAMKGATIDQQISLVNLFSSVGTKQALNIVVSKTKSTNDKLSDAAIRSLTKWKNVNALDALLDIASATKQLNYHVITLKAYITLAAKSEIPAADKVVNFKKAIEAARRLNEKRFVVSRLGQVKTVETLSMAVDLLDDKELAADAGLAVAKIALPDGRKSKGLKGPQVAVLLRQAYNKIEDKNLRNKLEEYIKRLPVKKNVNNNPAGQIQPPEGFVALFNGKDLTGWKGLMSRPYDNPINRGKLGKKEYAAQQAKADESMRKHWQVVDGVLYFDGKKGGHSLATASDYGDFEMLVDWKLMHANGDSGIYLRGSPQVQIWDPAFTKVGSGGLYNNKKNPSKPLVTADKPIGQWNTFRIKMVGEKVTVHLNGKLVVDNVTMENYWNKKKPIFPSGQIELQCHGNPVCFKNIFTVIP